MAQETSTTSPGPFFCLPCLPARRSSLAVLVLLVLVGACRPLFPYPCPHRLSGFPPVPPMSSCSWQVFGVLLVMVIALSWSSWSGSWACATTQPPHEQGLMAVVGAGQGARVVVVYIIFVSRRKKRNKEKKTYLWPRRRR